MIAPVFDFVDPAEFARDFTIAAIAQGAGREEFEGVGALTATDRINLDLGALAPLVVVHIDAAYPVDNFQEGVGAVIELEWQTVTSGVSPAVPASTLASRLLRALVWATRNGTMTSQGSVADLEITSLPVPVLGLADPTLESFVLGATATVQKGVADGIR